jgi:hypothetical protein
MNRTWLRDLVSRENLSRDLRTAAVALLVSVLVTATPSVAAKITNADKVDGKDAVGANASIAKRRGKLVATSRRGYLPDNIIKKARDADRLDGLDSSALVTRTAVRGEVLRGEWGAWGGGSAGYVADTVPFGKTLPVAIPASRFTVLDSADPYTANCPGPGQVVPRGWLCVYTNTQGGVTGLNGYNASDGSDDTSTIGFGVYGNCTAASCYQYGSWAVRAGTNADATPRPVPRAASNPR